jgi:archaellum component FlaC
MDVTEQERKKKGNKRDKPEHDSPTNEERVFQRSKVIDRTPTKTEINRQQQNTKMEEIKTMIQQLSQDFKEEMTKFKREIKEDIQEIKDDINILKTEARQNREKVEDLNGKICKVEREWTREKK